MTIQQLPVYTGEIPALGQEQSQFNTNVSDKLAYDAQLVPAQNIYATEANALAAQVESDASDAESSAAAAASNANFKGNWSDATGTSNIPASYRHNGRNWQQLQNIADITTQEPSENSFWTELSNLTQANIGGLTSYQAASVSDMIDGMTVSGLTISHAVGQVWCTGYTSWGVESISSPMTESNFTPKGTVSSLDYIKSSLTFNVDLQDHIDSTSQNGAPYVYFPTYSVDYEILTPLTFELGDIRIFGDKAQQYNHPFQDGTPRQFRTGNLIAATGNSDCIMDLGNSKTTASARNLAMAYTVDHLSFVGNGIGGADAIQYTGKQNGPDRPLNLSDLSVYNCKAGLRFVDSGPGVSIQYATLNLHNSTMGFNDIAVVAEGPIFGAHINDCNLEANVNGCIHGNFNKALTINNNMMENTKNPVNVDTTSGVKLRSWGNYFEYHPTSDYLYRVYCPLAYLENAVDVSGDIFSGGIPDFPILIEGAGRFTVKTDAPVKLKPDISDQPMVINIESNILSSTEGYKVDDLKNTLLIGVNDGLHRIDVSSEWIHSYPTLSPFLSSNPLGLTNISDMADGIQIDAGESIQGKLVVHNMLIMAKSSFPEDFPPVVLQARTPGGAFVSGPGNIVDYIETDISHGGWALCSIAWVASNNVQTFEFFIEEAARNYFYVAGVTTKVYGAYAGDGTDPTFTINPVMPNLI